MSLNSSVTLRDIAKALGVSHSAVSLALRDSPRISSLLRENVHRVAREMGYHPNPMAAALGQLRGESVLRSVSTELAWLNGWSVPQKLRSFKEFDLYWKGAFRAAEKYGYRLTEFLCDSRMPASRLESIFIARNIRGILIPPHGRNTLDLTAFHWEKFAAVRFGHSVKYPPVHLVTSDQLSNSLIAWDNICASGYQRIGYVTNPVTELRTHFTAGFLMGQAALPPKQRLPILFMPSDEPTSKNLSILAQWLDQYRPDALLTEIAALGKMLQEIGRRVPNDVGLATLSLMDGNVDTGIDQNSEDIGVTAVEQVVSQITHGTYGIPPICKKTLVSGKWIKGTSMPSPSIAKKVLRISTGRFHVKSAAAFPFSPRTPPVYAN